MLSGQVALVTGASRGIGQAIALDLGKKGASVIGTATSREGAETISRYLKEAGVKGEGAVLEVRDQPMVNALVSHIEKTYGTTTILVNNAGITRDNLSIRMKDDEWDDVLEIDLKSVFRLSRAVMRGMMKARHGRIVNITSIVGHSGNPGQANYSAAKAGVAGMSRSLARELGGRNITVNCVAPGFIDTDMTKSLDPDHRKALLAAIPLGRLGAPEDVAGAVGFLVSSGAAYVTGVTIHVNGGMYLD